MSTPPVPYSGTAINARLQGTVNAIDAGSGNGSLILRAGATPLASFQMIKPCGIVANQVLTFSGTLRLQRRQPPATPAMRLSWTAMGPSWCRGWLWQPQPPIRQPTFS